MNYYPFHIGDFTSHTAHLDLIEDLAYRRCIDLYMLTEGPLSSDFDALVKRLRMRGQEAAVRAVLDEFFVHTESGWVHDRCEKEIARARTAIDSQRAKAKKRWEHKQDAGAMPGQCRGNAGSMPDRCPQDQDQDQDQEKEREREHAAGAASRSRSTSIPLEFPSEAELAWCESERPELAAGTVAVQFRDYHLAHGSTMKSWPAAWRTWVRKERPPARAAPARQPSALEVQADVIAKILRQPAANAQTVEVFDERPRLSASRN